MGQEHRRSFSSENKEILLHIEEIFKKYVTTPINDQNRKQALLPSKAKIFKNEKVEEANTDSAVAEEASK